VKYFILILLIPATIFAQEFQFRQEYDTIPITINGWTPFASFTGGESETAPELCDIDGDGDFDFFVGNWGFSLTYFENIGTNTIPQFKFRTKRYDGITIDSVTGGRTYPLFCDLDADGDKDLILGDFDGKIHFWRNDGSAQNATYTLITDSLQNIVVSGFCKPELWDCDDDGDFDLFIGDYWGKVAFYRNIGTPQQSNFSLVSNFWLNIDVGFNSCPKFVDIDADGDEDLFIGAENGKIYFYRNNGTPQQYNFSYVTNNYNNIDVGDYSVPKFADIDHDGDFDLFIGREDLVSNSPSIGDLYFYENTGTPQNVDLELVTQDYLAFDLGKGIFTELADIDADHDFDFFFLQQSCGNLAYFINTGTVNEPRLHLESLNYQNLSINRYLIDFTDIDGDGDPDLCIGSGRNPAPSLARLYFYANTGSPRNANLSTLRYLTLPLSRRTLDNPLFFDIDADGDYDVLIRDNGNNLYYFPNIGNQINPIYGSPVFNWQNLSGIGFSGLRCYDIDNDGDLDLFAVAPDQVNHVYFFRNIGTSIEPHLRLVTQHFLIPDFPFYSDNLQICDIDHDGDGDLFISCYEGGMLFFRNITDDSTGVAGRPLKHPQRQRATLSINPSPANPKTAISIQLSALSFVNLSVYDITGRKVSELVNGTMSAGEHTVSWNASGNASGVYLVRLQTPTESVTQKVVAVK
jgi:hypothetical protein